MAHIMRGVAFVASAVVLAGCSLVQSELRESADSPGADDKRAYAGVEVAEHAGLTAGMVLPLEPYLIPGEHAILHVDAQDIVVERCMADKGYDADILLDEPRRDHAATASNMMRRYGISRMDWAEKYGYGLPPDYDDPPEDAEYEPSSDAEWLAYWGDESRHDSDGYGGCVGEALDAVPQFQYELAQGLSSEASRRSESDPRVVEIISQWSACMSERGFHYQSPYDAPGNMTLPADEIPIAVADVECKEKTGLIQAWFEVESEIQRELIEENLTALEEAKAANEVAMERVAEVIADYTGGN